MGLKKFSFDDWIATLLLVAALVPVIYLSFFRQFECDTGDSIVHFFFAQQAPSNFMLYFDHWAKPLFTLLASPFALFGFGGIKFFNGLIGLGSALTAFLVARKLGLKFPWLSILFVLLAPSYFVKLFSGYTEPLFGLILILSVYFAVCRKLSLAAILISFLPFVRSEGLILIFVFALYFILVRQFRMLFYLATGHAVYAIAGQLAGKSLFWVFTDIPYNMISGYGQGPLFAYTEKLLLTLGVPLFVLCFFGLVLMISSLLRKRMQVVPCCRLESQVLILGSFLAYFLFHSFSWGFGLFGSMGLSRVLCALVPLQGILSLITINFIISRIQPELRWARVSSLILIASYVILFPFMHNPASFNFEKDFKRSTEMLLMHKIAKDITSNYAGKFLYYSNPYLSYTLNINHFDDSAHICFTNWHAEKMTRRNSILIWDSWFSVVEEKTDSTVLLNDTAFKMIARYADPKKEDSPVFLVFEHR